MVKETEPVLWDQVVRPGHYILEALKKELYLNNFAVFIASPDDMLESRGVKYPTMRDNVLLEIGLFSGVLGIQRSFLVCPESPNIKLPSDLEGITYVTFDSDWASRDTRGRNSALRVACRTIRVYIKEQWPEIEAGFYKDYERALRNSLIKLLDLLLSYKENETILKIGSIISNTLWKSGFHQLLLDVGKKIEEAAVQNNKPWIQLETLVNLGWIIACSGKKEEAVNVLNKSIDLAQELKDPFWEAKCIRHLAGIDYSNNELDTAQDKLLKAKEIAQRIQDKGRKTEILAGIAHGFSEIFLSLGLLSKAEESIHESEKLYSRLNDIDRGIKVVTQKGKLEEKRGNPEIAKEFFEAGLERAISHKRRDDEIRNLYGLYRVLTKLRDERKALEKKKLAEKLQETVPMLYI